MACNVPITLIKQKARIFRSVLPARTVTINLEASAGGKEIIKCSVTAPYPG